MLSRVRDQELARRYSVTQEVPMIVIFPNGDEKKMTMYTVDAFAENMEEEVFEMSNAMLSVSREGSVLDVLQSKGGGRASDQGAENSVPSISLTDLGGIRLLASRKRDNMVVSFCKKGEVLICRCGSSPQIQCPITKKPLYKQLKLALLCGGCYVGHKLQCTSNNSKQIF